jgi:type-F conjugative transfer system pilin assembly protein TrbC
MRKFSHVVSIILIALSVSVVSYAEKLPETNIDPKVLEAVREEMHKFQQGTVEGIDTKKLNKSPDNDIVKEILKNIDPQYADIELPKPHDKLYYFISFSMSDESLKQAVSDAEKYGADFVIRGLANEDFKETIYKIKEIIGEHRVEFLIDPILFEYYKVGECKGCSLIPTLVYAKNVDPICETCSDNIDAVKISGNVTMGYLLNKIAAKDIGVIKFIKRKGD